MKKMFWAQFCALALSFMLAQVATAQADISTATLRGAIADPSRAVIPNVTVTARSTERGAMRSTVTGADGVYQIPLLQPGEYELRLEARGFQTQVVKNVVLTIGQVLALDVQLKTGEVAAEISVNADTPLIETERTQQANTIEQRQIAALPNITRAFTDYVFTLPGVADSSMAFTQNAARTLARQTPSTNISIGGGSGRSNYVTIDGGENESGSGSLRIRNMSVEAIQEFQVNRNGFNAEYGFTTGTALNVITKSGTNSLHGSAYLFYRSQKTSARNPLFFGNNKPYEQYVFPGFNLGGPLKQNKAFFFVSYENLKLDQAFIRSYTSSAALLNPTAAQSAYLAQLETGPAATANTRR